MVYNYSPQWSTIITQLEANYSVEDEDKARKWMEEVVGEEIGEHFYNGLKDGSYLCKLLNKLQPGVIPAKHEKKIGQNFKQVGSYMCTTYFHVDRHLVPHNHVIENN